MSEPVSQERIDAAKAQLDNHLVDVINWHFSPETGSPFWLEWAKNAGWDPREEVKSADDLIKFPHFQD